MWSGFSGDGILAKIYSYYYYFIVWLARAGNWIWNQGKLLNDIRARVTSSSFGRVFTWTFLFAVLTAISDFLKIGFDQTVAIFKGVANDPFLLRGGSLVSWVTQSLSPAVTHATSLFPEFWRWFLWWIGGDWLVWVFLCSVIFSFCGWLLSIMAKAIASIIRMLLQFV